jgi:hypothetical protein
VVFLFVFIQLQNSATFDYTLKLKIMFKNLKLRENLIILSLALSVGAFSQTISNGDFETRSSPPNCSAGGHPINLATPWQGIRIDPPNSYCDYITNNPPYVFSSLPSADYFDNSITVSCQFGSGPFWNGGNSYAMGHEQDGFGYYDVIYQGISGSLNFGTNYVVECFVRANSPAPSTPLGHFSAFLVNQNLGSTAAAIGGDVDAQAKAIGQGNISPNLTAIGGGWYKFKQIIPCPVTGNYYLVLGDFFYCNDLVNQGLDWQWQIDDVTFKKEPCVRYYGQYTQDPIGCCPITGYNAKLIQPLSVSACAIVDWVDCGNTSLTVDPADQPDFAFGTLGEVAPYIDLTRNGSVPMPGCKFFCISAYGPCCEAVNQKIQVCLGEVVGCCRPMAPTGTSISNDSQNDSDKIVAYPNPASKVLSLKISKAAESIKIHNYAGRMVYTINNVKEGNLNIDVSQFDKGVYYLSALIDSENQNIKITIE